MNNAGLFLLVCLLCAAFALAYWNAAQDAAAWEHNFREMEAKYYKCKGFPGYTEQ